MQMLPPGASVTALDPSLLEAVAAVLVESAAGLPGGATVGIVARVERVLRDYPRYVGPLGETLAILAPADALAPARAALERSRPALFALLLEVVVGAWALSEPVWEALGHEGQRDL